MVLLDIQRKDSSCYAEKKLFRTVMFYDIVIQL